MTFGGSQQFADVHIVQISFFHQVRVEQWYCFNHWDYLLIFNIVLLCTLYIQSFRIVRL